MICVTCGNVEGGRKGQPRPCSQCGQALQRESQENVRRAAEALALARIRELVAQWSDEGLIERHSQLRILDRLDTTRQAEEHARREAEARAEYERQEAKARAEYEENERRVRAEQAAQNAMIHAELKNRAERLRREADARAALAEAEVPQGDGALGAGLSALTALDDERPVSVRTPGKWETEVRPLLYENVGWFIGTLLVLAGSIYGVREAWRTLGGIARHVTVGGALFAYHALFVGLSALLARKSVTTGKVLSSIALGLLPIVFVALSSTLQVSLPSGVMIGLLFGAASLFTVSSIGRRLEVASPLSFALAFVPGLLAELPLAITDPDAVGRVAVPFVGVGALLVVARFSGLATQLSVGYGAIALGIYALVGGPDNAARGALASAGFGLWAAALAGAVIVATEREDTRGAHPKTASVAGVAALGVILVATMRAAGPLFTGVVAQNVVIADALTALSAVAAFGWIGRRRNAGLHFATICAGIAGFLLARAAMPDTVGAWPLGTATAAGLAFVGGRFLDDRQRRPVVGWGVVLAIIVMIAAPSIDAVQKTPFRWTFAAMTLIAMTAHLGASVQRRGLHYLGGVAAVCAAFAWMLPSSRDGAATAERVLLGAAAAFAVAAFVFDRKNDEPKRARPFDDLSSAALLWTIVPAATRYTLPARLSVDPRAWIAAVSLRPAIAIVGLALVARSVRDRTGWGSFLGAIVLGSLLVAISGASSAGESAWVLAVVALSLALLANARGTHADDEKVVQRHLFGAIPLPFPARGARAIGDGLARASWLASFASLLAIVGWLAQRVEADRPRVVMAGALLIVTQLVGFFTPAFAVWGMRGSVASLSIGGVFVGVTAVANRIGRPLPPPVVGWKLSLVAIAVWLFAQLARKKGPALGRSLGNDEAGKHYHAVFHTGVALLAALLVIDAVLLSGGATTQALSAIPPTMLIGSAIALALLSGSLSTPWLVHLAAPLAIGGAALIAAQRSVLGSAPPILLGAPVAWGRALLGPSVCGVLLAGSAAGVQRRKSEAHALPLAVWTAIVAFVVVASGWFRAEVLPAALVTLSGIVLVVDRPKLGRAVAATGAILLVHAAAQDALRLPVWAGPAIALFAVIALLADEDPLLDGFAALATLVGFAYAFAQGGAPNPIAAGPAVISAALRSLDGRWVLLDAPGPTAAIVGVGLAIAGARSRNVTRSHVAHVLGALVLALAATSGTFFVDRALNPSQWRASWDLGTWLLRRLGPSLACVIAVLALGHHTLAVVGRGFGKSDGGARAARDLLLLGTAVAGIAFVLAGFAPVPFGPSGNAMLIGFAAIAIAMATAAHAAFREHSSRHVYYVQLAIVASYGLFRSEVARNLPPEADATFALILGFLLLGVTVQARRAKIAEIAASTRTFAALLPIAVALWMPHRASMSAALVAAASGALYGALAWLDKSRLLGSLGAAAANLALLLVARSQGLSGREIDLAALGLLILALGHVFTTAMEHGARVAIRVVGGLFLYAPAALRLASDLGSGPNGAYSVGFGAACLLGILVGMVLHIRAYLAFGTLFLVLDVVANLTAAGLRDHRIGFLVLSAAGLSVLGVMVLVTLQRERVQAVARALRLSLRGWD